MTFMKTNNTITLNNWIKESHSDDERKELFLSMDMAMKYVHDRGYCIKTFNPKEIELLDGSISKVKFNTLLEMPLDNEYQKKLMREDIFNSSMLQVGIYSNCLDYISKSFIKDNFDSFLVFLPEVDAPYYRGVIERDAMIYFSEFEVERRKREINDLEKQVAGDKVDPLNNSYDLDKMLVNDRINNSIYKQINNFKDSASAFLNLYIYPIMFLVLFIIFLIVYFVLKSM